MVAKNLIFHLGMPKTGTSILQNCLQKSAHSLIDSHGVLFTSAGRSGIAHHKFVSELCNIDNDQINLFSKNFSIQLLEECQNYKKVGTLLLSSESFTNLCGKNVANKLATLLLSLQNNFNCSSYIYIREISDFLESMYLQSTRFHRLNISFTEYLKSRRNWVKSLFEGLIFLRHTCPNIFNIKYVKDSFNILNEFEPILGLPYQYLSNYSSNIPSAKKFSLKQQISLMFFHDIELHIGFKLSRKNLIHFYQSGFTFYDDISEYSCYDEGQQSEIYMFAIDIAKDLNFIQYYENFSLERKFVSGKPKLERCLLTRCDINFLSKYRKYIELSPKEYF